MLRRIEEYSVEGAVDVHAGSPQYCPGRIGARIVCGHDVMRMLARLTLQVSVLDHVSRKNNAVALEDVVQRVTNTGNKPIKGNSEIVACLSLDRSWAWYPASTTWPEAIVVGAMIKEVLNNLRHALVVVQPIFLRQINGLRGE